MKFYKCCTPRLKGFGSKWGTEWPHRWFLFHRIRLGVLLRWRDFFFGIGRRPGTWWFIAVELGPVILYTIGRKSTDDNDV